MYKEVNEAIYVSKLGKSQKKKNGRFLNSLTFKNRSLSNINQKKSEG